MELTSAQRKGCVTSPMNGYLDKISRKFPVLHNGGFALHTFVSNQHKILVPANVRKKTSSE
jgi:hypothetical protein